MPKLSAPDKVFEDEEEEAQQTDADVVKGDLIKVCYGTNRV